MRKTVKVLLTVALAVLMICTLVACGETDTQQSGNDVNYTISFDCNGGSAVANLVVDGKSEIFLPRTTKDRYSFAGWFVDNDTFNVRFNLAYITANPTKTSIKLYAKWTIKQYMVTFDSNGGSNVAPITKDCNTSVTKPTDPTRNGYAFLDWCKDSNLATIFEFEIELLTKDTTLYAKWIKETSPEFFDFTFTDSTNTAYSIEKKADITLPNEVVLPSSYNGKPVTSIGGYAFSGCRGLISITIPNSVTSIGGDAFYGCSGLASITIPDSVTSIGGDAFYGCSGLASITIPDSVTSIESFAFFDTAWLNNQPKGLVYAGKVAYCYKGTMPQNTTITLRDDTKGIASDAFDGCSGLTSITIPDSVTSIGGDAFSGCSGLTSITIPNSVTSIEYFAFSGCSGLTGVTIGSGVTSIGVWAFSSCSGLTSVTIPASVTSIGYMAFYDCSGLTSVTIPASVTSISSYAFYDCSKLATINCEVTSKPSGWDSWWRACDAKVVWGYTGA